jgi:hypothetical protein
MFLWILGNREAVQRTAHAREQHWEQMSENGEAFVI